SILEHGAVQPAPPDSAPALQDPQRVIRELQQDLLDLTDDSIFVCDMDSVILFWNHGAEKLFGWEKAEAVGQNALILLRTEFPTSFAQVREALIGRGEWAGDLVHSGRDGTRIRVTTRWVLQRDERGQPVGVLAMANDATERRRAAIAERQRL